MPEAGYSLKPHAEYNPGNLSRLALQLFRDMVSLGVKPKPKKTTLFISIPVILVVVVVLLLQFTQSGYLTTVP
ncbi:MAG: hypothetical protein IJ608_07365, partial [Lachnospiraceae bacterium]|nr:hypothetical protein [Lachnospiraceae bacterium]